MTDMCNAGVVRAHCASCVGY